MNKKGSILMISLWILSILVVFAVGLGHRAAINLKLGRYQRDRLKAHCLAMAGVQKAIATLKDDTTTASTVDSLDESWSTGLDAGKPISENVEIIPGSGENFTVRYLYDKDTNAYLCMEDEERKININGIDTDFKKSLLAKLFEFAGAKKPIELRDLVVKWIDPTPDPAEDIENIFKNNKLKYPEELLLILEYFYKNEGEPEPAKIAQAIYGKIKDLITVHTDGALNINTITKVNLQNLFSASLEQMGGQPDLPTEVQAQELLDAILIFRGANHPFGDINKINTDDLMLQPNDHKRKIIDSLITGKIITVESKNFRIESTGYVNNITKKINAIYNRKDEMVVYWHEN